MTDNIGLKIAIIAVLATVVVLASRSVFDPRIRPWVVAATLAFAFALSSRATTGWLHGVTIVAAVTSLVIAVVSRALARRGTNSGYSATRTRE